MFRIGVFVSLSLISVLARNKVSILLRPNPTGSVTLKNVQVEVVS